ncbi:MAG: flagellar filament capping protein FliD [Burkholderiales bacterium]|nr:flagellar filament capping protein FliD [Burkholderiales bacterium]
MAISAPGVGSNLDVNSIVTQLMAIEQRPRLLLDAKEADYRARLSAYGQLRSALAALQTSVRGLTDPAKFLTRTATTGDASIASATATASASNATYDIAVSKLAQQQSLSTAGQASSTAAIGTGAETILTFQFGTISGGTLDAGKYTGATYTQNGTVATGTVKIDSTNNSLQGIRDAINAANIGVTASILNVGGTDPFRLVLQSTGGGAAGSMKITATGDSAIAGLLAHDPAGAQNLIQTVEGQDAALTINGLSVSSPTNTLSEAIQGVKLTLAKEGTTSVTVSQDSTGAQATVQGLVKAYNELVGQIRSLTGVDTENNTAGPLVGDSAARTVQRQLREALSGALPNNGQTVRVLSQVGVTFQKDGTLAFDSGKFSQAVASDAAAVGRLFGSGGAASDSLIRVVGSGSATVPGQYAVDISEIATRATLVGAAPASLTITAGVNDTLSLTVDGTTTQISLTAGTYTAAQLAAQVQSLANSSAALKSASAAVTVSEDAGVLTVTSKRYGSASTVAAGGSAAASLFGAAPTAIAGKDVAGTVGGLAALGSGQKLTGASGSAVAGLVLEVNGGATGGRGVVNFARGFAARLDALLDGALASKDGSIASRTNGINQTIKALDSQREVLDRRLAQIEQRYRKQFVALDRAMSSLTSTSNFLAQQLARLPGASNQS